MPRPDLSSIPAFYHRYVNLASEADAKQAIAFNTEKTLNFLQSISEEKWSYRYAQEKWSVKEMVQHLIDAERIFAYRALCIARKEKASLPGFDENQYAASSKADARSKDDLVGEFRTVREGTTLLFASFDEEQLAETGTANSNSIDVNGIGFIIAGHVQHHLNILQERYL